MKTAKLAFIPLLLFIFIGCSKEVSIKNKLTSGGGKWKIAQYERYIWAPGSNYATQVNWCNDCGEISFKNNKTGELIVDNQAAQFKYSISDEKLVLYIGDESTTFAIKWNWNNSQFTLNSYTGANGMSLTYSCKK